MDINTKILKKNAFRVTKERGMTASRIRVPGGHLDAKYLSQIQHIAETFGNGTVHITSRQGFEIPGIPFEKMPEVNAALQSLIDGLEINQDEVGCGYPAAGTRNITACVGNRVCPFACYDTTALAQRIEKAVFPNDLHFKIALTGCPNDCAKVRMHDFGIMGMTVPHEGKNFPSGTIGCDALNIPAALIKQITELCGSLNLFMGAMQLGMANAELFTSARESALQIVHKLKDIPPFSYLEEKRITAHIQKVFSNEYLENAMAYAQSLASGNLMNALDPQYQKALTLLRVVPVLAHLGYSLEQFQDTMLQFAESLNTAEQERSPSGYAASFGDFFSSNPSLSEEDGSWMSLTNASVQYVPAIQPGSNTPQLVKRMHYVSFVGMFRSDLFEGLCVGHAPKKCPICGRWFLTTNARHTKYCGNLAPGDKLHRTCRQIGNLQGRSQRELAADHPIKQIYERRCNTINRYVKRGTLDADIAKRMKKLAKDKMLRALSNVSYAKGCYESEMEQESLLREVKQK